MLGMLTGSLLVWAVAVAALDVRHRRIPNVLTLPACLTSLAHMSMTGRCLLGDTWDSGAWAGLFGLAVTLPAYALGKLGAGDAKYLLAIGLIGGWPLTRNTFVIAAGLGVLVGAAWWLLRRTALARSGSSNLVASLLHGLTRSSGNSPDQLYMPFGTLLSIGFCAELLKR